LTQQIFLALAVAQTSFGGNATVPGEIGRHLGRSGTVKKTQVACQ